MIDSICPNGHRYDSTVQGNCTECPSLRDQFAMAAIGVQASEGESDAEHIARDAYSIADAMLKARDE